MMQRLFTVFLVLLSAVAVAATRDVAYTNGAAEIRSLLLENARAFEQKDMIALESIWANDDAVSVFENTHANFGWLDYRDQQLAPQLRDLQNIVYDISDVKTRVSAGLAWATFNYSIHADYQGRAIRSIGLGTAVFEKRNGDWKIVHWHTSVPRTGASVVPVK